MLRRVPSHMSYNVTVVDRAGKFATVLSGAGPAGGGHAAALHDQPSAAGGLAGAGAVLAHGRAGGSLEGAAGGEKADGGGVDLRVPGGAELFSLTDVRASVWLHTAARSAEGCGARRCTGRAMTQRELSCADFAEGSRTVSHAGRGAEAGVVAVFAAMLAECLERRITADWSRLGQFWAGASHAPAPRLN